MKWRIYLMNADLHNVIMAEKVSSRGHLLSVPTPEKGDHRPSITCTGAKHPGEDKHSWCQKNKGDNIVINVRRLSNTI